MPSEFPSSFHVLNAERAMLKCAYVNILLCIINIKLKYSMLKERRNGKRNTKQRKWILKAR